VIQAKALPRRERLRLISQMQRESNQWPNRLVKIPMDQWPADVLEMPHRPTSVFRSRTMLVQVYDAIGPTRISVSGTVPRSDGEWPELNWEELQRAKAECGLGDFWMVELYPPDADVVNVANMRHLWLIPEPEFGWKR